MTENEENSIGFATIVTRSNKEILDSYYLFTFLNTDKHKNWAVQMSTGDGRTLYKEDVKNMILYHGSNVEVRNPRIINTNKGLDFGSGFYVTSDKEQAKRWSVLKTKRRGIGLPVLSVFEFHIEYAEKNLRMKKFVKPDLEWLNFVVDNRKGLYKGTCYDIVFGPVANDRTILTINDYISGAIPAKTSLILLEPANLTDQYAFLTYDGIKTLEFKEAVRDAG